MAPTVWQTDRDLVVFKRVALFDTIKSQAGRIMQKAGARSTAKGATTLHVGPLIHACGFSPPDREKNTKPDA
jgi:hypothetical protein